MRDWKRRLRGWLGFWPVLGMLIALAPLIIQGLEGAGMAMPWSQANSCNFHEVDHSSDIQDKLYHPLSRWPYHSEPSPRVRLITITRQSEPDILNDPCVSRRFMGMLVRQLDRMRARIIVVDKYYSTQSCHDEAVNSDFRAALAHSIAPVVVGQSAEEATTGEGSCLMLSPQFDFTSAGAPAPNVMYGLTRLNADTLKLPLRWPLADAKGKLVTPATSGDSLSLVAARAYDPNIEAREDVAAMLKADKHPFAIFMRQPTLQPLSAMTVLCSTKAGSKDADDLKPTQGGRWSEKCAIASPPCDGAAEPEDRQCEAGVGRNLRVAGSVIVIGDESDQDMHPFPGARDGAPGIKDGEIYGVYLQANYIEALLDGRFLKVTPPWITWTALGLWMSAVYLIFWFAEFRRAAIYCLIGFTFLIAVSLGALLATTYYTPASLVWAAGVVVVSHWLGMRAGQFSKRVGDLHLHKKKAAPDKGGAR